MNPWNNLEILIGLFSFYQRKNELLIMISSVLHKIKTIVFLINTKNYYLSLILL